MLYYTQLNGLLGIKNKSFDEYVVITTILILRGVFCYCLFFMYRIR